MALSGGLLRQSRRALELLERFFRKSLDMSLEREYTQGMKVKAFRTIAQIEQAYEAGDIRHDTRASRFYDQDGWVEEVVCFSGHFTFDSDAIIDSETGNVILVKDSNGTWWGESEVPYGKVLVEL